VVKRSRFDWQRSHVIVTGGSQGIGAAVARAARARGAAVSVIARGEEQLLATAEPIGAAWACAGTALPGRFLDVPIDEFESQMRLNYLGAVHAARAVLPGMVSRGRGHLVLTSSTAGVVGVVGYSGYGPTKAAVHQLAHCLRYEVEPAGVTVAVLYPPDTDTPGFAAENTRKPPETAAVSGAIDPLTRVLVRAGGIAEPIPRPILARTIRRARESG